MSWCQQKTKRLETVKLGTVKLGNWDWKLWLGNWDCETGLWNCETGDCETGKLWTVKLDCETVKLGTVKTRLWNCDWETGDCETGKLWTVKLGTGKTGLWNWETVDCETGTGKLLGLLLSSISFGLSVCLPRPPQADWRHYCCVRSFILSVDSAQPISGLVCPRGTWPTNQRSPLA